jgi:hypothetical protein
VILQLLDVVSDPLHLPEVFFTATIILLVIGFPVALLLAWLFKIGSYGEGAQTSPASAEISATSTRSVAETGLLAIGMVWLIAQDIASEQSRDKTSASLPIVVLLDTYAPRGVYDEDTVVRNGTNADVLSDELAGLPLVIQKETIGSVWDREDQIIKQNPDFIVIHRSAFFHSMNQELGFG